MSNTLVFRLVDKGAQWVTMDSRGGQLGQVRTDDLHMLSVAAKQYRLILLVPGADVLVTSARVPLKSAAKTLKAVPYALEENLIADVETQHFAISRKDEDDSVGVAVIDKSRLEQLLEMLKEAGIEPDEVIPETLGLPWSDGQSTMLVRGDNSVGLRTGRWETAFLVGLQPADVIEFLPADSQAEHFRIFCDKAVLKSIADRAGHADIQLLEETDLPLLASQVICGPSINFLQGNFAPRSQLGENIKPWRLAASLLLALFLTVFARDVLRLQQIKSVRQSLDRQMASVLTTTCPGQTRIVNPLHQLLTCTGSGESTFASQYFLETLILVSAALPSDRGIKILSISFAEEGMELRLDVPDYATLDNIQRKVSEAVEFTAEIQSTSQEENRVEGRIRIHRNEDQA
ncbi:MAG: type II secretion system protein GspL [Gammaproteobacteria bacterium]|nr:type II secretion system protein GspL [Gammaproteobacteria bacterium]